MAKVFVEVADMSRRFALKAFDGHLCYTKKHVTLGLGEQLVEEGRADRRVDRDGTVWFLLHRGDATAPVVVRVRVIPETTHKTAECVRSCVVLSRAEVEAAIDPGRRSHTTGMSEVRRVARMVKGWQAEDFVERSKMKLSCFRPGTLQREASAG